MTLVERNGQLVEEYKCPKCKDAGVVHPTKVNKRTGELTTDYSHVVACPACVGKLTAEREKREWWHE